jgi:uroporphyrinogen-III decarboxylase
MMTSRERVTLALNHKEPDRVPLDLGSTSVTGMHVTTIYKLRQALALDKPGTPVKLMDPLQLLGEIKPDLIDTLGIDFVGLTRRHNRFGMKNDGWKPWTFFDGTPLLVPGEFNIDPEPNGDILQYPQGDRSAPASARMPKDGFYFDAIIRQPPIDDDKLNVEDNLEEFGPISEEELESLRQETEQLYRDTDKAIVVPAVGTSFGDIGVIPGMELKHPKGIRDIEEWYMSMATRRDYIYRVFDRQCEIALANLEKMHRAVGSRVAVLRVTGTDFGQQQGPFVSPKTYRDLFKPFHKRVNDWVHQHTNWKTFIHSCGSIRALLEDFIDAGFDILNPVQCSAAGMGPVELKKDFGDRIVFWGGGVDTQRTLPFGKPLEVRREVRERIKALAPSGGFVFNPVHNVQARTPVENLLAMFETVREYGRYPVR